ncbi:hypothetical protein BO86DRAFT_166510 [Aspergillus japonicus CBS 114.51]|uniref:Uncharacterized protein n=1 Tax=Aspergillus japonicus CBS 114.51 TaxID=1448312 RepID=A0A8T8XC12_ASPJA|nr:hypothetical protein BO86DRAFT_166510 [Aspergillus japonicus CBS 114.51]RAH85786.1 hypothetical protein BO86DRAFT_166510 [Aspergillus japonicus CBS 114.51]
MHSLSLSLIADFPHSRPSYLVRSVTTKLPDQQHPPSKKAVTTHPGASDHHIVQPSLPSALHGELISLQPNRATGIDRSSQRPTHVQYLTTGRPSCAASSPHSSSKGQTMWGVKQFFQNKYMQPHFQMGGNHPPPLLFRRQLLAIGHQGRNQAMPENK